MSKKLSIICAACAAIMYGIQPSLITATYNYGGNSFSVNTYVALGGALLFGCILRIKKISVKVPWDTFKKLLILTTFGTSATTILLYFSYSRISYGIAVSIHFIYPVIIAIILAAFYHEKASATVIISIFLSVAGVALISGLSHIDHSGMDFIGIVSAIASGISWGFYIVYMEKSGLSAYDSRVVNFYMCLITVPESFLVGLITGNFKPIQFPNGWLMILAVVIVGRLLAGPLLQLGIKGIGALLSGVLETLEPVTALILSVLIGNESLTISKIAGSFLILSASVIISLQHMFNHNLKKTG